MATTKASEAGQELMTLLRRHRLANGLDQEAFAKRLGVTKSAVSLWEQGKCVPKAKMFPKIARVLGIDAMELTRVIDPPAAQSTGHAA